MNDETEKFLWLLGGVAAGATVALLAPDRTRNALGFLHASGATDAILEAASVPIPQLGRLRPLITER